MSCTELYPTSPRDVLTKLYVGTSIRNVPTPAAVVNLAAVRRNCERMLQACDKLELAWRAHVKTHKTLEITRFQVGEDATKPVNLIVSTLAEAEFLLPMLKEYQKQGRKVNVLYGLPMPRNALSRMVAIAQALGEGGVSMLLDDAGQVPILSELHRLSGIVPLAYIKIDMGGRRAGVEAQSQRFLELADAALEAHDRGRMILSGLYSHAGHSYGGDSPTAAVKMMAAELTALLQGADRLTARAADRSSAAGLHRLVLSAGASPTSLAVQNLIAAAEQQGHRKSPEGQIKPEVASLAGVLATARDRGHVVELHAGVYPILDLQQLAAHSVDPRRLSWGDMALTIVAEVHSRYPGRGAGGTDEALVGAGGLALAREPCKAYEGVAMLTPWGRCGASLPSCEVEDYRGWIVGRVSQEHGILTWRSGGAAEGESQAAEPDALPEVGDKVRLWPNHACIASSHYGWYFVVDESRCGKEDEIVDVYIRARGW